MESPDTKLNLAFLAVLKPLARLFLRYGRGIREFNELARTAFVSVASEDYGLDGRPTNASRIAAMTGMTRREVRRLKGKIANGGAGYTEFTTPIGDVIAAWRTDPEFLDEAELPATLPLDGDIGSFRALVKRYAGDIPVGAIRKELQRTAAIEPVDDALRLVEPSPAERIAEDLLAGQLRAGPYPLLSAIAATHMASEPDDGWPVELLQSASIRQSDIERVRQLLSGRLRAATAGVAELLEAYAALHEGEDEDEPRIPIAAGAFYAEGIDPPD